MEGSLEAELLIVNRYLYVGAALKEGFWCVDIPARKSHWNKVYPDMGTISLAAAAAGSAVFFCTDSARLYCVDAEKGFPRWVYQFPTGTKFSSPPAAVGNRIYCFTRNGLILGFDETQQGN
jgi:outer membrane protein assembly factor BamB